MVKGAFSFFNMASTVQYASKILYCGCEKGYVYKLLYDKKEEKEAKILRISYI